MSSFRLTPRALQDLDSIADFTLSRWGERQAEKYVSALHQCFQSPADHPLAGRVRDDIATGYRSYRQGSHLIFYIAEGDEIAIIGIPHGAMDIEAYFDVLE